MFDKYFSAYGCCAVGGRMGLGMGDVRVKGRVFRFADEDVFSAGARAGVSLQVGGRWREKSGFTKEE